MILLHTVWLSSWSREVKINYPSKFSNPLFSEVMLSKSKWLVGSSSIKKFGSSNIILLSIHLAFSPPDKTLTQYHHLLFYIV